jgi:hypothetical protein
MAEMSKKVMCNTSKRKLIEIDEIPGLCDDFDKSLTNKY